MNDIRFFKYIYLKKVFAEQYFVHVYIVETRSLVPFFIVKDKSIK